MLKQEELQAVEIAGPQELPRPPVPIGRKRNSTSIPLSSATALEGVADVVVSLDSELHNRRENVNAEQVSLTSDPEPTRTTNGGRNGTFSWGAGVTGLIVFHTFPAKALCFAISVT